MNLMKGIRIALLAAITMVMASGLPTTAVAQDAQAGACSSQIVTAQGQPQNHGGHPFDYPADAGGVNKKEEGPPMPANPTKKVCEGGKIQILMGNHRHFDWKIGDRIPVTVIIRTTPDVVVDFTTLLSQGKISFEPSDFELFGQPEVSSKDMPDGTKMHEVKFAVQTFVPKDVLVLNLDLRYSNSFAEDGTTRNWKIMTSPDFVISRHWTVDHGNELLEGDLDKQPLNVPWATQLVLVAGIFLILFFPGLALVKFLNRVRTRSNPPPETVAWAVFDKVLSEASMDNFTSEHYRLIDGALRGYLEAKLGVPVESQTIFEIRDRLGDEESFETIHRVITLCERVLFKEKPLTEAENAEIVTGISTLVPRHWDSKES